MVRPVALPCLLLACLTACTSLPEPRLAARAVEQSHTVAELSPGRYHVMVRGATFAPRATLETLLLERAAWICGARRPVVHHLEVVDHPALASGEVTCEPPPEPSPAAATAPPATGVVTAATGAASAGEANGAEIAELAPAPPVAASAVAREPVTPPKGQPLAHPPDTLPGGGSPSPMVAHGPGLLPRPPAPGYLPPFTRIGAAPLAGVGGAGPAAPHVDRAGWTDPRAGVAPHPGGSRRGAAQQAPGATPGAPSTGGEITSPPFWPRVRETYRAVYAGRAE